MGRRNRVFFISYYPYGEPWREPSGQPYLYGGKERMRDGGLYEYDHGARRLYSALPLWTAPDPLALQYAPVTPYVYCASNPIKFTDPTGCAVFYMEQKGQLVNVGTDGKDDGRTFVVNYSLGETIINQGGNYNGDLSNESNSIELTGLINLQTISLIEGLVLVGNASGREQGYHKDADNVNHVWDPGTEIEEVVDGAGKKYWEQGITTFKVNGTRAEEDIASSKEYAHIHSANKVSNAVGVSTPSNDDFRIDDDYREKGYKGITFTVGGQDRNITFYNGFNIIATFQLNELERLLLASKYSPIQNIIKY